MTDYFLMVNVKLIGLLGHGFEWTLIDKPYEEVKKECLRLMEAGAITDFLIDEVEEEEA